MDNIAVNTLNESRVNMRTFDTIAGFDVRPGLYDVNGATVVPVGVNFTVYSAGARSCELLLFHRRESEPFAVLPFPKNYRIGDVFSMMVFGLNIYEFEYAYRLDGDWMPEKGILFDKKNILLDPYAKAVTGQSEWGSPQSTRDFYKARVVRNDFDWGEYSQPRIPMSDLVIYEMHVRGFTRHPSSGVEHPGTFAGIIEKIPHLKRLGVNAVELMPVFEFDESRDRREYGGRTLLDYWGYNPISFFAPNTSYASNAEFNQEGTELKETIRTLHQNGIEVILDVVFNHTAEGDESGPIFSFKGFDNNVYYLLTPDGRYYNFSGCGNTVNCNHPIVQQMILESLRYWVINYRVDGFRFDLASILGRNEDGSPMMNPPLLHSLAFDPILRGVKLIAEAWDAGGLYQVGSFPAWNRWAEWNGKYRDDMRSFLKGDGGRALVAVNRIAGSPDVYDENNRGVDALVNFMTCHDGFTLKDLYSYNGKHNEANGWNSTDGSDDNRSWNCGIEGDTDDKSVQKLREKMMRNAAAALLCSRGTPMLLMGDEFGNTQFGNNNAYCQDNEISWLDWSRLEENGGLFDFIAYMIKFRKKHPVIRNKTKPSLTGFPDVSFHGMESWQAQYSGDTHTVAVMFAGCNEAGRDDIVYVAINAFWEDADMKMPKLPQNLRWEMAVDTGTERVEDNIPREDRGMPPVGDILNMKPRSVVVLYAAGIA